MISVWADNLIFQHNNLLHDIRENSQRRSVIVRNISKDEILNDFYEVFDAEDLQRKTSFVGEEIQYMPRSISSKEATARRHRAKASKFIEEAERLEAEALDMRRELAGKLIEHPSFFFASRNKGREGLAGWAVWDTVGGDPALPGDSECEEIRKEINRATDRRLKAFYASRAGASDD